MSEKRELERAKRGKNPWKGKEGSQKEKTYVGCFVKGTKASHVPQSDSAMEVTTEITNGKGYSSFSHFFSFFLYLSSKGCQEHDAKRYLRSREETHMRTSVWRSCFKNNHRRGVCLQSAAGDLQSRGKWDSSGAPSADSPKCLQDRVHLYSLPNHPTLTPVVVYKLKEVLFPCFLPKNIDPFSVALLDPFFLSQQLLNSTFKSLKNNPVSMNLQNIWQRNADLGTTLFRRWGLVHQEKKGKEYWQILEQDAHTQCSALAYLLQSTGTGSKLAAAIRKSITPYLLLQLPGG